jgi:hypothetical protein
MITIVEGNNQLNVALTPVAAPPVQPGAEGDITFDSFRLKCNFAAGTVESELIVTNHTESWAAPGDYIVVNESTLGVGTLFFATIGGIPPGTHIYTAQMWDKKEVIPGGTISLKLSLVHEGQAGSANIVILIESPTMILPWRMAQCGGVFSSAWAEWITIPVWAGPITG